MPHQDQPARQRAVAGVFVRTNDGSLLHKSIIAVLGLILIALLGGRVLTDRSIQVQRYERQEAAEAQQRNLDDARAFVRSGDIEKQIALEARERSRDEHEQKDLAAQWVAADAARIQIAIGVAGLIGLFFTVLFARHAAKTADKTFELQRATSQAELRAYISVEDLRAPAAGRNAFLFEIHNSGATPARSLRWTYRLGMYTDREKEDGILLTPTDEEGQVSAVVRSRGEPAAVQITHQQAPNVRAALANLSPDFPADFLIVVRYRDVFDRCWEMTEFVDFGEDRTGVSQASDNPDLLPVKYVDSREREITQEEFAKPIQLPPP